MTIPPIRRSIILSFIALAPLAHAEELSIQSVAARAIETDHQVVLLERRLRTQLEDLGLKGYLDEISLTLSGSITGDDDDATDNVQNGTGVLSASLEIIPQIILDGSLTATESSLETPGDEEDDIFSGSVGLTVLPLARSSRRARERLAAETTALELQGAANAAALSATTGFLDLVEAGEAIRIRELEQVVAERVLETTEVRHERDLATDTELAGARSSARAAAQAVLRSQIALERALAEVSLGLRLDDSQIEVPGYAALGLEEWETRAKAFLQSISPDSLAERDLTALQAKMSVRLEELDRRDARRFDPSFSLTASADLPALDYRIGAEIVVSPSQWDSGAVADAEADLLDAQTESAISKRLAQFDARAAIAEVQFAADDLQSAEAALATATTALDEAAFRLERGGITELERDQAELDAIRAADDLAVARIRIVRQYLAIEYGYAPEEQ